MNNFFWFITFILIFFSCNVESKKNKKWIENIFLSEKDILMATSFDLNTLLHKSDLLNSKELNYPQKKIINDFKSSFRSSLLGFNVDIPQKLFVVGENHNFNIAVFLVGELTNENLFKQTLKKYFDVEDVSESEINKFYLRDYNLHVIFNEYNFMVGFSPEKKYIESKLSSYFKDDPILKSNLAISKFLEKKDDIGFYFSNKRINEIKKGLGSSIFASQLNKFSLFDQFGNEIYLSLNFLKDKVSFITYSYHTNQEVYKDKGVNSVFKNFINLDKKVVSFGFLNLNLNLDENLTSNINFPNLNEDLLFFKILKDKKLLSTLNGEISFFFSDSIENQIFKNTDNIKEDEFWEDDFIESEIDNKLEIPPFLVSLGLKDIDVLTNQFKKINNDFIEDKSILVNDLYVHLADNILHVSNKKELLSLINNINHLNPSTIINSQFFQNPLYAEIDLQLILNYLQLNNLTQLLEKQINLFNKIIFTGNNNSLTICIDVMSNGENSLKSITSLILQNQLKESYL